MSEPDRIALRIRLTRAIELAEETDPRDRPLLLAAVVWPSPALREASRAEAADYVSPYSRHPRQVREEAMQHVAEGATSREAAERTAVPAGTVRMWRREARPAASEAAR